MTCCEAIGRLMLNLHFSLTFVFMIFAGLVAASAAMATANAYAFGIILFIMWCLTVTISLLLNELDLDWRNMCNNCLDDRWFAETATDEQKNCARSCSERPTLSQIERLRDRINPGVSGRPSWALAIVLLAAAGAATFVLPLFGFLYAVMAFAVFIYFLMASSILLDWRKTAAKIKTCRPCS